MNEVSVLTLVIALSVGVVLVLLVVFPLLKKKGIKTGEILDVAKVGVTGIDAVVEALKVVLPANPIVSAVDKIIDYAKIGVGKAEQLYLINEITGDERKDEAIRFVYESLELAGIEVTDDIKSIVDGSIEAAVLGLGHSGELLTIGEPEESYNGEK